MPKKSSPDPRSPEERWFASQRESVIKIHEFESQAEKLQRKVARLALIIDGYDVIIAGQVSRTLTLDINDPVLETELKDLRVSRRYRQYWYDARQLAQRLFDENQNTIQTLRRLLASAPYPGEGPLIDSPPLPEDMKEDAGSCRRAEGEGAHVVRPEAAPQAG